MHTFTYYSPTKIIFGEGTVPQLVPELQAAGITRVLLLTGGKSVYDSGLHAKVVELLRGAGIAAETVGGVQPNPRLSKVREAVAKARETGAQAIVPLGGGSVFDSSKAVAAGATSEHDIWDLMLKKHPVTAALPIYGVMTLSGTSSEINDTAMITNEETQEKFPFFNALVFPKTAIVDPTLQYTVPLSQIYYCGLDALTHILEPYLATMDTCEVITEHCEAYARGIIRCLRALPEGLRDYDIRSELAFCGTYAHSGWASVGRSRRGDFSSHRIAHALGAFYDLPHGVTMGIVMPNWMQYVYDQGKGHEIFSRFAVNIMGCSAAPGREAAREGITAFRDFVRSMGMPTSLTEAGIDAKDIPALADNAARTLPFGALVPMDTETIAAVLRQAL